MQTVQKRALVGNIKLYRWRGVAQAAPLLLKLNIPTPGAFLYCLHNLGRFIYFPTSGGLLSLSIFTESVQAASRCFYIHVLLVAPLGAGYMA